MVVINVFFIILFILSAAVQYNDPDPYIWITLYLYGALLCWLAIKKNYKKALFIAGIVVYSTYAAFLLFDANGVISWMRNHQAENIVQTMKATKPWIEETREFFWIAYFDFCIGHEYDLVVKGEKTEKERARLHILLFSILYHIPVTGVLTI